MSECCEVCAAAAGHKAGDCSGKSKKMIRLGSYEIPLRKLQVFGAAFVLWAGGFIMMEFLKLSGPARFLALIPLLGSYSLAGLPVLRNAWRNIRTGHAMDENFLMSIATIGAFAVGEWEEAAGVMIFYMIGELIQEMSVEKSRASIDTLLALRPDTARVKKGENWEEIPAGEAVPGERILVRPGERIPLDGLLEEGSGAVDVSMLTGESRPVSVVPGSELRSGTLSLDAVLIMRATKKSEDSAASRIIALVHSAAEAKAKPERFITAFARWYTPIVVGIALVLAFIPPFFIPGIPYFEGFKLWLYKALILLVISCPCALVVSVPLGYFAGIGGLSRRGIMVKGAAYLDALHYTRYVAFDKTGTLTQGSFRVVSIEAAPGVEEALLLETAALVEKESNHPIAKAICEYAKEQNVPEQGADRKQTEASYREYAGRGVELIVTGGSILAGNRNFLESRGVSIGQSTFPGTTFSTGPEQDKYEGSFSANLSSVEVSRNGAYLGRIFIGDAIKEGAAESVAQLKGLGIEDTVMLTGDSEGAALSTAGLLGIGRVAAGLLPEDKLAEVEQLTRAGTTVFVGDGINDAPVLARSDVGIAMGAGADAAVEAADVIIMTGDPRRVPEAISRAHYTRRIIVQNVVFCLLAKGLFITLAIMGLANMWAALIADVGVALAAIVNATRSLR